MEYLILGLLILSPMTGYELQQFIKNNLSLICSHSAGSIQTAIAKLKNQSKITCQDTSQGKRIKKVFLITDCGRQAFSDWVAQPMQADKVKNMELSKLFFLGLADKKERLHAVKGYIEQLEKVRNTLTAIRESFSVIKKEALSQDDKLYDVLKFQSYTIEYGLAAAEFEHNWYSQLLKKIEKE